jgi:SAM-dependent methyltransferase
VTGVDRDERSIEVARSNGGAGDVSYLRGDFLELPFPLGGFDLVTAVASLHHMDTAAALTRMRDLLRPGGVLVVIGLARDGLSRDLAVEVPAVVYHRIERRRHRRASRERWPAGERSSEGAVAGGAVPLGAVSLGAVPADGAYRAPVVWPPAETYQQIRRLAASLLPGMHYRRHLLWRYSICWVKPAAG